MSELASGKKDMPASVTDLVTRFESAHAPEIKTMAG